MAPHEIERDRRQAGNLAGKPLELGRRARLLRKAGKGLLRFFKLSLDPNARRLRIFRRPGRSLGRLLGFLIEARVSPYSPA
ncbi:hypothetical protein QP162_19205 [Sphingomonas aurantiaca]|uniref:hypothetical protein n=1 Tax=Sphingomonas aurantiaca TaxID=185949 RepID=UPI002FE2FFFB